MTPSTTDFDALRADSFSRLDEHNHVYLDYTGAGQYPAHLPPAHLALLQHVLGNPHSANPTSRHATHLVELARAHVLRFFNADPLKYTAIFTHNATAACKLVAESYPFRRRAALVLAADNHNSVHGVREYARRARARVAYVPLDSSLHLRDAPRVLRRHARDAGTALFAFPAQSNFSGVQHDLSLIGVAQALGYDVLLDAAAFAPTSRLDLSRHRPDFVTLSFYKMFGYPTGVGCLLVRNTALSKLRRPWFAGGTVNFVSVQHSVHELASGAAGFEDGTVSFLSIPAVSDGLAFLEGVGMDAVSMHVKRLTAHILEGLVALKGEDGRRMVRVHGPDTMYRRGGTVAFDVMRDGSRIDPRLVEAFMNERRISVRVGCFCNPGAAEKALGLNTSKMGRCLGQGWCLQKRGSFSVEGVSECIGEAYLGSVRVSVGVGAVMRDVERFLKAMEEFCVELQQGELMLKEKVEGIDLGGREMGQARTV